ncbi:hypothetical protein LEP1GSC034_3880 [Leptospira interrogans str. 2003000735]|uniref:Uncharacterized protein n=8 Tax=Leptospira interrogans TaxID=173 RepID=A0A0E2DIN2_LEPIR|nr:hypothetical protein LEP1GSC007_0311 [Leptospira interrogans serovar Bulgarica str. Mallika]EJP16756.1 hypothetical protein LEP1GSC080_3101 [Leptospira interrogans str. FPW2026]EKN89021.1 hypothetical protein LEP1GSC027_4230 [Leptospira interrogans str. 2002000624]EKO05212.1 hypothetical protein LEP1GSC077_4312 [Leptospira interrogans str. C10069]EKO24416.1 hypothetical protein LEP1GSC104_0810 [Leptospira interrogans str. UI 12621]EKQ39050.1 hypothetical protein LEP1GSC025_0544 [Leptospira 
MLILHKKVWANPPALLDYAFSSDQQLELKIRLKTKSFPKFNLL